MDLLELMPMFSSGRTPRKPVPIHSGKKAPPARSSLPCLRQIRSATGRRLRTAPTNKHDAARAHNGRVYLVFGLKLGLTGVANLRHGRARG